MIGAKVVTFRLISGALKFHVMDVIVISELADIEKAWDQRPEGHRPPLIGEFNINLDYLRD